MVDFFTASLGEGRTEANALDWSQLVEGAAAKPQQPAWTTPEAFIAILLAAVMAVAALFLPASSRAKDPRSP